MRKIGNKRKLEKCLEKTIQKHNSNGYARIDSIRLDYIEDYEMFCFRIEGQYGIEIIENEKADVEYYKDFYLDCYREDDLKIIAFKFNQLLQNDERFSAYF